MRAFSGVFVLQKPFGGYTFTSQLSEFIHHLDVRNIWPSNTQNLFHHFLQSLTNVYNCLFTHICH